MPKVFLWGTGRVAIQILEQYDVLQQYDVIGFIDNDRTKQGGTFYGKSIYAPDILQEKEWDQIFVLIDNYYEEICRQIRKLLNTETNLSLLNYKFFYKQDLLKRYENSEDVEIKSILNYIHKNDLQVFNYDFTEQYQKVNVDVAYDSTCGMYYVFHNGKRLYFAKSLNTTQKVERYYRSLLLEQDEQSPHRYLTQGFEVQEGDIVVDAGAAEGNFGLEVVEKVSKIYLIEADPEWIEALHKTFYNYREKTVIIQNYLTSLDKGKYATLDSLIKDPVNFIKMDIEGNEWDALLGAEKLIKTSENLKCAICVYHSDYDEILVKDVLSKYEMECSVTSGYMWFPFPRRKSYVSTKLCRGIVHGIKGQKHKRESIWSGRE